MRILRVGMEMVSSLVVPLLVQVLVEGLFVAGRTFVVERSMPSAQMKVAISQHWLHHLSLSSHHQSSC